MVRSRQVVTAFAALTTLALVAGCGAAASSQPAAVSSPVVASQAPVAPATPAPAPTATPTPAPPTTGPTQVIPATAAPTGDSAAAEQYCTAQGGMLVDRIATWNTNADPSQWVELAGRQTFCEFEMTEDGNTTRISVDLTTLYSEQPTLAGLAYLAKLAPPLTKNGANPAQANCNDNLNGTSDFGTAPAAGGGWVDQAQETFVVMNMCMFADGSAIDEWGITYYADGTVRGADLATRMRYQPGGNVPAIFPATGR
jgi:hypothetical protein